VVFTGRLRECICRAYDFSARVVSRNWCVFTRRRADVVVVKVFVVRVTVLWCMLLRSCRVFSFIQTRTIVSSILLALQPRLLRRCACLRIVITRPADSQHHAQYVSEESVGCVYETEDANNERGVRLSKDIVKVAGRCVGWLWAVVRSVLCARVWKFVFRLCAL
jgi:hypothetical protein